MADNRQARELEQAAELKRELKEKEYWKKMNQPKMTEQMGRLARARSGSRGDLLQTPTQNGRQPSSNNRMGSA